ncbi:hypothetical protein EX30DRAFT_113309 [Ascodesmis nigricans]|uniref:Uncharacterized protein n=1 Tax=Ascodesmis nigricans TaxID=341454 RepID=A0A4S2MQC1_9PEZI|nr:hypothetical protein EX30DRAFT_113309 [Ascodesmis nigricans]
MPLVNGFAVKVRMAGGGQTQGARRATAAAAESALLLLLSRWVVGRVRGGCCLARPNSMRGTILRPIEFGITPPRHLVLTATSACQLLTLQGIAVSSLHASSVTTATRASTNDSSKPKPISDSRPRSSRILLDGQSSNYNIGTGCIMAASILLTRTDKIRSSPSTPNDPTTIHSDCMHHLSSSSSSSIDSPSPLLFPCFNLI